MSRAALPNEACGLIGGKKTSTEYEAVSVHSVKNAASSPTVFALDGQGMIDAETRIDDAGHELLAVWHSHPTTAAVPSQVDLADAHKYDPHGSLLHVLVSMQGFAPQVRAYRYGCSQHVGEGDDEADGQTLRKYCLVRLGS